MIAADRTVRKSVARLIASFKINDRVASRLQCSVARIAAPFGPKGRSLAGFAGRDLQRDELAARLSTPWRWAGNPRRKGRRNLDMQPSGCI